MVESLHDNGQDVAAKFGDASRLNNPTNYTYGFKTRDGSVGLLQVTGFTENPPVATIRYKLVQPATNQVVAASGGIGKETRELLSQRLEAASSINNIIEKDKPLAAIATDAAKAGEVEIAKQALAQMFGLMKRDETANKSALLLAKCGLRKQAIEMAKEISNFTIRDRTLSELAQ